MAKYVIIKRSILLNSEKIELILQNIQNLKQIFIKIFLGQIMDVIKDDYVVMLSMFYKKVIKQHKKRKLLIASFNTFLSENNKERYDSNSSNRRPLQLQNQIVKSTNNFKQQTSTTLNQISSVQFLKSQSSFKDQNELYSSASLLKVLAFAFIYYLIQTGDSQRFKSISNEIAVYLATYQLFDQATLKRVNFLWSNIVKFLAKRSKIRWVFQMKQAYNQFNQDFIRLFIYVVLNKKIQFEKIDSKFAQNPQFWNIMAKSMELTIVSFNIKNNFIENLKRIGTQKQQIAIGYQTDSKKYIFLNQIPVVKDNKKGQSTQFTKKISSTIDILLQDYNNNTERLMGLNFLRQMGSKQARIKKHLSMN